jgi:hypothetical protein
VSPELPLSAGSSASDREVLLAKLLQELHRSGSDSRRGVREQTWRFRLFHMGGPPADAEFRLRVIIVGLGSRGRSPVT